MAHTYWFNFKTKEYTLEDPTEETATEYFDQHPAALGLYRCYWELGDPMLEAIMKVLMACLGIKHSEEAA